jgi:hypothetical protein
MATKLKNLKVKDLKAFQAKHFSGRPAKPDKDQFGQITCVLRLDTIERLRKGADSTRFGEFLQHHLDRFPPPSREQYLALLQRTDYWTLNKRKRIPTLMASGSSRAARREARARARYESLSPKERAWQDSLRETVIKAMAE